MFIGDEYVLIRAVAGTLPEELGSQHLLVVSCAYLRLQLSEEMVRSAALEARPPTAHRVPWGGQITRQLLNLTHDELGTLFDPDPGIFTVVPEDDLASEVSRTKADAASKGINLNLIAAQYVAAATLHRAPLWFGHPRNVPRPIRGGHFFNQVRYQVLSDPN